MINLAYCVYLLLLSRLEDRRARHRIANKACKGRNPEKTKASNKASREKNIEKYRAYRRGYSSRRVATDPCFRLETCLRTRMVHALKGRIKSASTLELLGCSAEQLKQHLEKQFQLGMTWETYGPTGWHIDHKKPCASFDLTDPAQQKECFHYSNLQPLWAVENIKKGDSYGRG